MTRKRTGIHTSSHYTDRARLGKYTPEAIVRPGDGYAYVLINGMNTYPTKKMAETRARSWSRLHEFRSRVFKMKNGMWGVYGTD